MNNGKRFKDGKEIILRIITIFVSILTTAFLLEIWLQLFPPQEFFINSPYLYTKLEGRHNYGTVFHTYREIYPLQFDTRGYYRLSNGVIDYNSNQFGARWIQPKTQALGDKNVIVLGDSFTYGFGLRYQDAYIYKLQNLLKADGLDLSFFNFSVPARDPQHCLVIYKRVADRVPHQFVLYGLFINKLIRFPTSYIVTDDPAYKGQWLHIREHSKLADFLFTSICKITDRKRKIHEILDPSNFKKDDFIKNMEAIKQINKESSMRGAKLMVIILPILVDLRQRTFKPVFDEIKQELRDNHIEYVDLSDVLHSYNDPDLWILPFDQHPNEKANEIFAETLAKLLRGYFVTP